MTREEEINDLIAQYPTSVSRKKRRDLLEVSPSSFHSFRVGVIISDCCKRLDLALASSTYMSAKAEGVYPSANVFCNFLNLAAGFGEQGSGTGPRRTHEPPSDADTAFIVFSDMKTQGLSIGESIYSAMIRCSCAHGRMEQALQLYEEMKAADIAPKLRTFTHITQLLSERSQLVRCLAVFDDMVQRHGITPSERIFLSVFLVLLKYMERASSREKETAAVQFGGCALDQISICQRFQSALQMYMADIPLPTSADVLDVLKEWFSSIEQPTYTCTATSVSKDGLLAVPCEQLRSLDLLPEQREKLIEQLDSIAVTRDETHRIKLNSKVKEDMMRRAFEDPSLVADSLKRAERSEPSQSCEGDAHANKRSKHADDSRPAAQVGRHSSDRNADEAERIVKWTHFKSWLERHAQHECGIDTQPRAVGEVLNGGSEHRHASCTCDTFDVVVDGANVGYFKQNFVGAPSHVDYQQIDQLIQFLTVQRKLRPLLILHSRHLSRYNVPDEAAQQIIDRWKAADLLYATPKGFNDDWFWIYAAVKYHCKIVTNDEMRDHHFQMLSPE